MTLKEKLSDIKDNIIELALYAPLTYAKYLGAAGTLVVVFVLREPETKLLGVGILLWALAALFGVFYFVNEYNDLVERDAHENFNHFAEDKNDKEELQRFIEDERKRYTFFHYAWIEYREIFCLPIFTILFTAILFGLGIGALIKF